MPCHSPAQNAECPALRSGAQRTRIPGEGWWRAGSVQGHHVDGGLANALTPTPNTLWVLNSGSRVSEGWRQAGDDSARFWFEIKIQRKLKSREAT